MNDPIDEGIETQMIACLPIVLFLSQRSFKTSRTMFLINLNSLDVVLVTHQLRTRIHPRYRGFTHLKNETETYCSVLNETYYRPNSTREDFGPVLSAVCGTKSSSLSK